MTAGPGPQPPGLREEITLEAKHYHLPDQALRFARIFAYTLAAQLLSSGGRITGWSGLWSLLAAAAETAFRQWRKTMPVPAAQAVIADHEAAAAPLPAATDT